MSHFQVFYNLKDTSFNDGLMKNLNQRLENEGRIVPTRSSAEQKTASFLIELQKSTATIPNNLPVVNNCTGVMNLKNGVAQ